MNNECKKTVLNITSASIHSKVKLSVCRSFRKPALFLFTTVILLITSAPGVAQNSAGINTLDEDDIWAKTLESSSFSEFWNYQIYLDNGMSLYINFSVSNISSLRSPVSRIRISMYNLDGQNYVINREYPLENLLQNKEEYKFDINPSQDNIWFKGKLPDSHEIYINTDKSGERFKIHLHFEDIQNGIKYGDGLFEMDESSIGIITHIPFARVSGSAGINDNVQEVSGTAYMDHTQHFGNSGKLLQSGYRFIQHNSERNWEITYFLNPQDTNSADLIGYHLSSDDGIITVHTFELEESVANYYSRNKEYPEEFYIDLEDGRKINFFHRKEIDRHSVFNELNWVVRSLARRFIGGEYYDYRGIGEIQINDGPYRPGHFNYFIVR